MFSAGQTAVSIQKKAVSPPHVDPGTIFGWYRAAESRCRALCTRHHTIPTGNILRRLSESIAAGMPFTRTQPSPMQDTRKSLNAADPPEDI